jgi:prepilin-type N-terminal cleavage/methylation domain-containing protein
MNWNTETLRYGDRKCFPQCLRVSVFNPGFSLLELLVAMSIFGVIIFCGYEALNSDRELFHQMIIRTKPEAESNYRQLLIQGLISHSTEGFKRDPFTEEAPHFFQDLNFGQETTADKFSIVRPTSDPAPFQKEGSLFRTSAKLKADAVLLLAGCDTGGNFQWNYARISHVSVIGNYQYLALTALSTNDEVQFGSLQQVQVWGFSFHQDTLYLVSPSGSSEPYFAVDSFSYQWNKPLLNLQWQPNLNPISFQVSP